MMLMQYLAGWRLSRRDYMRALQDNFTVFMTLIRAIMIGFLGFEMGFAVTNKVRAGILLLLSVALLLERHLLLHACSHQCAVVYGCVNVSVYTVQYDVALSAYSSYTIY
eukprot:18636-Heterococcus_DN1.PRE.2